MSSEENEEKKVPSTDTADISNTETSSFARPGTAGEKADPLMIRDTDTSKLKRVTPKTQNINLDGDNYTDTVHLKVIKERKKQLSGILTASQTIRLRPPSADAKQSGTKPAGAAAATMRVNLPPSGAGTLKVADPSSTDTGTIKVSGPAPASGGTLRVKAPVSTDTQPSAAGTLKIKAPVSTDTQPAASGTLKVKAPTSPGSAGTLKIKSSAGASSASGTLKIKASGPTEGASGTLKIKSPGSASDETLKVSSDRKGGTLKLKTGATQRAAAPQGARTATAQEGEAEAASLPEVDPRAKPGVFTILPGLVATGFLGVMVFRCVEQYYDMFTIIFDK